ncbi:hypothetical protein ACCS91_33455 [Rhizobium ruizarguesonis]
MATILSGDYKGAAIWKTSFPWFGTQAKYFQGIQIWFQNDRRFYPSAEIARVKELGAATEFNSSEAVGAAIGGVILAGPVGAVAALGARKNSFTYGIEFKDGKKIVVREEYPNLKFFQIFKRYVEQNQLLDIQF